MNKETRQCLTFHPLLNMHSSRDLHRPTTAIGPAWNWALRPWRWTVAMLVCVLLLFLPTGCQSYSSNVTVFRNPNRELNFEHMVVDQNTGRIYIGGVNRLYELHPTMLLKMSVVTGPEDDSPYCQDRAGREGGTACDYPRKPTNSYNKALAILKRRSKLIECSSLFQGRCRFRSLYNISQPAPPAESPHPLVANTEEASTVIFVAPGPPDPLTDIVLNVASTYSNPLADERTAQSFRSSDVPSVGSFSLREVGSNEQLLPLAFKDIRSQTRFDIKMEFRTSYLVDYVTGFHSSGFSFFLTRQPRHVLNHGTSHYHSRLVRLCDADKRYYSYMEVPLVCSKNGIEYNLIQDGFVAKPGFDLARNLGVKTNDDVLFAVFTKGAGDESKYPTRNSALCVFSINEINRVFMRNILECHRNRAMKGLEQFTTNLPCVETSMPENQIECGNEVNFPLEGGIPVEGEAFVTETDAHMTAVAARTVVSHTVVFMGTGDGRLIKASVNSVSESYVYDRQEVDRGNNAVLPDMEFDMAKDHVLVMTSSSLSKIPVHNCERERRCKSCLAARDPFCGWCSLGNRCSLKEECENSGATQWISPTDGQCTTIKEVVPDKIQINTARFLKLRVENMPQVDQGQLSCVFTVKGHSFTMGVSRQDDGVQCSTPQSSLLPPIDAGEHSIVATLSVQLDQGPELASTDFTFYDCASYDSCSQCVQSDFPCDWCAQRNGCTGNSENWCRGQHIINGMNRHGQSSRKGPSFCPRIFSPTPDIYVSSGTTRQIEVQAQNLLDFQTQFQCVFKIEHSVHRKTAALQGEQIVCDPMDFSFFGEGRGNGTAVAELSVTFGQNKALDNNQNVRVIMYKCRDLAPNCGRCLSLPSSQFQCGWCSAQSVCTAEDRCTEVPTTTSDGFIVKKWLTGYDSCPDPRILSFEPTKGPQTGGTRITVRGVNLGRNVSELTNVSVANVRCDVVPTSFENSESFVCVTRPRPGNGQNKGPVIIKLKDSFRYTALSTEHFEYVSAQVTGISPLEGPKDGGTDLRISGSNLDLGSHVKIQVAGVPCQLKNRTSAKLYCRTGMALTAKSGMIEIKVDSTANYFNERIQYHYRPNPRVTQVFKPISITSGGIMVEVKGLGFSIVQRARIRVVYNKTEYWGEQCVIKSDNLMYCKTPRLDGIASRNRPTTNVPLKLEYGFQLDDVKNETEKSSQPDFTKMIVYPDPIIERFGNKETRDLPKGPEALAINGRNLDTAAKLEDVRVKVGKADCNMTGLATTVLTCTPPREKPQPINPNSPHPEVVVRIGHRQYNIGYLNYDQTEPGVFGMPKETIIAIAVAIAVFIVAILILLLAYRRKSTRHTRQMKGLKAQMDTIEMKVASECKEAFAELQTSMSELRHEMTVGIPFVSYRDFVTNVLFPNSLDHPVLRDLEVDPHRAPLIEKGLRQFNQLLMNKTFLLHFVRTMEGNKYFLGKDRVYVGSLLMVILQEKMEYCTDILKTLLSELIERTVERRYQPKILFRRSESVAERMLAAWFTFLMHRYLVECAGQPLFMLYWAIKQQVEKGPQDSLSYEARYSLSEEKLLRQSVDFHALTVFVSGLDQGQQVVETPVRVLDCDTVSQVKEKCLDAIYRTTPYSCRPAPSDLDLEWRTGVSGRLVLQDLDMTTKTEQGGWKRLNTLAHYKVPNNASLALIPRQASMYNLSLLSEKSDKSSTFSLKNSPTLSRPLGVNNQHGKDPDTGCKVYHLVKAHDQGGGPDASGNRDRDKLVTEIYLTRLLTTKGTLQKFTEDLLEAIFTTAHRGSTLPLCIKYMFDFMDDQAMYHGITDPETVHTWKSNALPLRFWVNLIKNPQFLFDIPRPTKIEGCLSVVAQTLMDACSTQDHMLTKDSPSSKLLFARDIMVYRDWVDKYYHDIQQIQPISDQDMNAFLAEESRSHPNQFYVYSALNELYKYLDQYKEQLAVALNEDEFARRSRLPLKLEDMLRTMDGDIYCAG